MTPYVESRKDEFIPSTLETITYQDKNGASRTRPTRASSTTAPTRSTRRPTTWQEVYDVAAKDDGIAYQGASYEGLTVDFLELAFAAGGQVLSEDGTKAEIDSPENLKALQVHGRRHQERRGAEGRDHLHGGARAARVRVRPRDVHAQLALLLRARPEGGETKGKFAVAPFPAFEGGGNAGILGGANLVISAYSKNPGAALKFIDYMTHAGAPGRGRRRSSPTRRR